MTNGRLRSEKRMRPLSMTVSRLVIVMVPARFLAAGLRLQRAVQRRGRVLGDDVAGGNTAVVGDDDLLAVFEQDVDGSPLERLAVLAEDVSLRAVAHDGVGGQDEH